MAAPAASALALPAGWFLSPRCIRVPAYGGTKPPLLKVAKQPTSVRRFAPASLRKCVAALANGRQELEATEYQFDDVEPLWLAVVKDVAAGLRGLVAFLAEQPRQLKHLEWPGFQNTSSTLAVEDSCAHSYTCSCVYCCIVNC
ncbi:uncharacterized protein LOC133896783 isoform X2 [Phragmites australis]|uniref:uncharacterized protein LOC133896783 isoform X2 n=1 Tax=Phragmites australis TaxID=29695 RepID=UPI002D7936AA|nr:uncharacterized protein LOC133896783 isoform X2 [Phragmites australis]